ncbi:hypothetical protein BGAL_0483g00010 [Botrytis galanthina]|uniref:Uncharacterized protein n=1 Tax=Botrytis galanthina TaxID=278940 RepID=A0A4S8QL51_9HELO|nr:hypothetical protein BGAL_0483g00010 [Botrytis galanthina]
MAPTGKLLDGYSVLNGAILVLDVAAGSSVMVDDMIAGVEVDALGFVANDEEDTVTVLSRVDMPTAARDEEDIIVGEGEVIVGTASQTAEPGAFAHTPEIPKSSKAGWLFNSVSSDSWCKSNTYQVVEINPETPQPAEHAPLSKQNPYNPQSATVTASEQKPHKLF